MRHQISQHSQRKWLQEQSSESISSFWFFYEINVFFTCSITLSRNSFVNLFVCWFEISKSNEFIGNLIGVCAIIGNSRIFTFDSYQYLSTSVHARTTTAFFQNAFTAWCSAESHQRSGYLSQSETIRRKSGVSRIVQPASCGCHLRMTSQTSNHNSFNLFARYCASFT